MNPSLTPGPDVDVKEDLYRVITTSAWWVAEEKRPSSAAFKHTTFSTDIASIAGSPETTLARFPVGCGLVVFNCGDAKGLGFLARKEIDPQYPENLAHANVYNNAAPSKRKTMAQELIKMIVALNGIVKVPEFPTSAE